MRIYWQKDRFIFKGTVRELREYLAAFPKGSITLYEYITRHLH